MKKKIYKDRGFKIKIVILVPKADTIFGKDTISWKKCPVKVAGCGIGVRKLTCTCINNKKWFC